jgi:hypothetical protein
MYPIHTKIVTDEKMHPIAVQIDYADWLEIQKILKRTKVKATQQLNKYAGTIELKEDPLEYQQKIREEWK